MKITPAVKLSISILSTFQRNIHLKRNDLINCKDSNYYSCFYSFLTFCKLEHCCGNKIKALLWKARAFVVKKISQTRQQMQTKFMCP